jgi:hypothetical protein
MTVIRYSVTKLFIAIVLSLGTLPIVIQMLNSERGKLQFLGLICVIIFPMLAVGAAMKLLGKGEALRFDSETIYIEGLWKKRDARWSEVIDIDIRTISSYAFYGLVKTGSTDNIFVQFQDGLFGGTKIQLSPMFLEKQGMNNRALLEKMQSAWSKHAVGNGVGYHETAASSAQGSSSFDTDIVMARYLAQREREQNNPALNGVASFGRKRVG